MSVPVRKRQISSLELFNNWYNTRKELTDLLLRTFGLDREKFHNKLVHRFKKEPQYMNENELKQYNKLKEQEISFFEWFIPSERDTITRYIREITKEMFIANSMYPTNDLELQERRLHQDKAIGYCYVIEQELYYTMQSLPVDINKYTYFATMIDKEIKLLKGWRKSNKKLIG